jgi:hypothetical protein
VSLARWHLRAGGHDSGAFFSPLFSSMQYPVDRLEGELFRIVFFTYPFKEFFAPNVALKNC